MIDALAVVDFGEKIEKVLSFLSERNDRRFQEERDEIFRGWVAELAAILRTELPKLAQRQAALESQIAERLEEHEAFAVLRNMAKQAYEEAIDDRRRMLAFAVVGLYDIRMTVAEVARVERTLRELDPEDVRSLWRMSMCAGRVWREREFQNEAAIRHQLWAESPSADALLACGCVRITFKGLDGYQEAIVTKLGTLVLRVLRAFTAMEDSTVGIPGRELPPASRSQEQALKLLQTLDPQFWTEALSLGRSTHGMYHFPKHHVKEGKVISQPYFNGHAFIDFQQVDEAMAQRLRNMSPPHPRPEIMPGQPCEGVWIDAWQTDGTDGYLVRVHGPHDVLRWLADEIEATWA